MDILFKVEIVVRVKIILEVILKVGIIFKLKLSYHRSQVSNPLNMRIPSFKSRAGSQGFRVKGPTIWNAVPNEMRSIERREVFKNSTKRFLLDKYSRKSECTNPRCNDHCFHTS